MPRYTAEILIDSPLDEVWDVLEDLGSYNEWNPFTPVVSSDLHPGSPVHMKVRMKPGSRMIDQTEYVETYNPPYKIAWGMNWPGLLTALRTQDLEEMANGLVRYRTSDHIQGILSPLVHLMYGKHIQSGMESVASALKERVESNGSAI